jgi:hypothetical protein
MPNASYVAKPGVAPDRWPDYEPPGGWDQDWPFPGPMPPGYEPEDPRFGATITGNTTVKIGQAYTPTFRLHENESGQTWRTEEPHAGSSSITWTATLDGAPLLFSIGGSPNAYSIVTYYEHVGLGWYGDDPPITFALNDNDGDKTIVLTATSDGEVGSTTNPDSFSVTANKTITVDPPVYTIEAIIGPVSYYNDLDAGHVAYTDFKFTMTHTGDATGWRGIRIQQNPGGGNGFTYYQGGNPAGVNLVADTSGVYLSPVITCTDSEYYSGRLEQTGYSGSFGPFDRAYANMTATVTVKKDGIAVDSNTHSWISDESGVVDLRFSFSTAVGIVSWNGDWP